MHYCAAKISMMMIIGTLSACGTDNPYKNKVASNKFFDSSLNHPPALAIAEFDQTLGTWLPNPALMPFYCNPYKYPTIANSARACARYLAPPTIQEYRIKEHVGRRSDYNDDDDHYHR